MHSIDRHQAVEVVRACATAFEQAEAGNPFASTAWFEHFLREIATDDWRFTLARSDEGGASLLMACQTPERPRRHVAVANYYTSLYPAFVSTVTDPAARASIATHLARRLAEPAAGCAVIDLVPLDAASADTASLRAAFRDQGWYTKVYDCFGNWTLPLTGQSFDAYMAARPSRLISTWNRKRKRFERGDNGARLELVTTPEHVDAAMDAYEAVYARSWKQAEPYPGFIRGWARICAERGWLRLGVAWLGQVPIAAQFWFTAHGRANIFKLAYDEQHAGLSAGTVLSGMLFRQAIDVDRVQEIDYLTGDDAYKQAWMTRRRQRVGLIACNPRTVRGLIVAGKELAGVVTRRWRRAPDGASGNPG